MKLLEFITEHIQYTALKQIYQVILENYRIGRCIPKLVTPLKTPKDLEIHQRVLKTVERLAQGDTDTFSAQVAEQFKEIQRLILETCETLGYLQLADQVYASRALWQERNIVKARPGGMT